MKVRMTEDWSECTGWPVKGDVLEVVDDCVEEGCYLCTWFDGEDPINVYYYECEVVE